MKKQEARTTITVASEAHTLLRKLADDNSWSVAEAARTAFEALEVLLDLHTRTAENAAEPDVADLMVTVARLMPAELVEGKRTEWGRLSDGRPALILPMEIDGAKQQDWFFAADSDNGGVMAARRDGGQIGQIKRGRLQPLTVTVAVEEVAALN